MSVEVGVDMRCVHQAPSPGKDAFFKEGFYDTLLTRCFSYHQPTLTGEKKIRRKVNKFSAN